MKNLIGTTTGAVHSWSTSINDQISILRKAKISCIEVLLETPDDMRLVSKENIAFLNSCDYISIHSPFHYGNDQTIIYGDDAASKNIISSLEKFYEKINAKAIVFHPDSVRSWSVFRGTKMNVCAENMERKRRVKIGDLETIFDRYGPRMVFDSAHALTFGKTYLSNLFMKFKKNIQHYHFSDRRFSASKNKMGCHQQLIGCKDMHKFDILRELDCPVIVEIDINDKIGNIKNLRDELVFVKKYFSHQ